MCIETDMSLISLVQVFKVKKKPLSLLPVVLITTLEEELDTTTSVSLFFLFLSCLATAHSVSAIDGVLFLFLS